MRRQAYIRPSRANSFMGVIAGSIMLIIGIASIIHMASANSPPPAAVFVFLAVWSCVALGGVIYNLYNVSTGNAIPMEVVDYNDADQPRDPGAFENYSVVDRLPDAETSPPNSDSATRLKELQSLLDQKLITLHEFNQKRSEILSQL